ncbi:32837_t:CDS:2 [Racocetra persica]|uniref:32837_t:CDS:1 n=1 Tax=Racocetra persica TaxID=160502 RepID=A0ACA9QAN8_9GLOM|nr:32837_t:CDS:2 [Racocetra persica]
MEFKSQFPQLFEKLSMPKLSKYTSEIWKTLPTEVKSTYSELTAEVMSIHSELYPDYACKPHKKFIAVFKKGNS